MNISKIENRIQFIIENPDKAEEVSGKISGSTFTKPEIEAFFEACGQEQSDRRVKEVLGAWKSAMCGKAIAYPEILQKVEDSNDLRKIFCASFEKYYVGVDSFAILDYPQIFGGLFDKIKPYEYPKLKGTITEAIENVVLDKLSQLRKVEHSYDDAINFFLGGFEKIVADGRIFRLYYELVTVKVFKLMSDEQKLKWVQEKELSDNLQVYLRLDSEEEPKNRWYLAAYAKHRQLCSVVEAVEIDFNWTSNVVDRDYIRKYKLGTVALKALKRSGNGDWINVYLLRKDLTHGDLAKYAEA